MTSKIQKLRDELMRKHDINKNPDVFSPWSFDAAAELYEEKLEKFREGISQSTKAAESALAALVKKDAMIARLQEQRDRVCLDYCKKTLGGPAEVINILNAELEGGDSND